MHCPYCQHPETNVLDSRVTSDTDSIRRRRECGACEKRPVKREKIERAVDEIEILLRQMDRTEVPSRVVGELVSEKLRGLDEVAYVRFASVYRRFTDASQFAEEVAKLKNHDAPKSIRGKAKKVVASALA